MTEPSTFPAKQSADAELLQRWQQGQCVDVDVFLAGFTDLDATQVVAVLLVDQSERWKAGQHVPAENYLRRFPTLEADAEAVVELAYGEFLLREEHGERPCLEELLWRFPNHEARLRQQVELHLALVAPGAESTPSQTTLVQEPALLSGGPVVPGYEILEILGRGGMGIVYKARQVKANRLVALKMILHGGHASEADLQRFRTEAMAVARLQHPNIVTVYEVDEYGGMPFFSMELCTADSLDRQLAGTPLEPRKAAALVQTLAQAMHCAHQANVIHRDLKPANILLSFSRDAESSERSARSLEGTDRTDGTDTSSLSCLSHQDTDEGALRSEDSASRLNGVVPKITDFGLARRLDVAGQTSTGAILGTPSYMAPEQATGKSNEIGPAADVYALGAILYECLTGRPPFKAATPLDTILQVSSEPPVPPSQLQTKTPRDLETICLKCLRKEPEGRYRSAQELADDLQRWQAGEPITARPVGRIERTWRWCRRNPVVSALMGAIAFLLVAGTITAWYLALDATWAKNQALAEKARADEEADTAWSNQYVAHMNLMAGDWDLGNIDRLRDILEIYRRPPAGRKDVRGLEWYCQERVCNQELRTLSGHTDMVYAVAFSPDGKWLASASDDRTVKLWDVATSRLHGTLVHPDRANYVAFSPDGIQLASTSDDGLVRLWNVENGQEPRVFKGHTNWVWGVAFSPDGKWLASGSDDTTAKLWDVATGRELLSFKGHNGRVASVAFSPDGARLATGSTDHTVKLWDTTTGRELFTRMTGGSALAVTFRPDGRYVAASAGNDVKLWDAVSGQAMRPLVGHTRATASVAFSPDGKWLASTSDDRTVKLWDVAKAEELRTFKGHASVVKHVTFSPDGTRLASAGGDGAVKLWDAGTGQVPRLFTGHTGGVFGVAISPDATRLASGSGDTTVRLWDIATGRSLALSGHSKQVHCVAFSPDGKQLASASSDGTVKLWDSAGSQRPLTLEGHTGDVFSVDFSPDGMRLASAGKDNTIRLWDTVTGRELSKLEGHSNDVSANFRVVRSVAFSPDGQWLASAGGRGLVKLWNVSTGVPIRSFSIYAVSVSTVAFSPDGTQLASGSNHGAVKLWNAATGEELWTLSAHTGGVNCVAFSPDGTRLASASGDGTVKLWDVAGGRELYTLKGQRNGVRCLAFSRDGTRLAMAGADRSVRLWDGRPLTPQIKAEYEARDLVETLLARRLPGSAIRTAVQNQLILGEAARRYALELVERLPDETDPEKYRAGASWVIGHPYGNVFMCRDAVVQMKAACRLAPDKPIYSIFLGIAQYRLGKYSKESYASALATLTSCNQKDPRTLAFLAMTQHQLGHTEEARNILLRLRAIRGVDAALLREAAAMIEGRP